MVHCLNWLLMSPRIIRNNRKIPQLIVNVYITVIRYIRTTGRQNWGSNDTGPVLFVYYLTEAVTGRAAITDWNEIHCISVRCAFMTKKKNSSCSVLAILSCLEVAAGGSGISIHLTGRWCNLLCSVKYYLKSFKL